MIDYYYWALENALLNSAKPNTRNYDIKRVIFSNPATIVYWDDGSKTVVKCGKHDKFDQEKGLAMAIVKKYYGNNGSYNEIFKKWCDKY